VKCRFCKRQNGLRKLKRELKVLVGFHQQQTARQCALDVGVSSKAVERVYRRLRERLTHLCEIEGTKMSGEIELDEAYFGGKRKGQRGRAAAGKSVVFGLLERDGRVYTRGVYSVDAATLMEIIRNKTRKGSVYFTDSFKSYNSLHRFGKHYRVNHDKAFATCRAHLNGIEGFWSFTKHRMYNYRGVSRANFPLYLKEMEWRYNHRNENTLQLLIHIYFGYVSE
jgi:transposase